MFHDDLRRVTLERIVQPVSRNNLSPEITDSGDKLFLSKMIPHPLDKNPQVLGTIKNAYN